jgi:transcriptional regulator with XRE-family HTH domain
LIIESQLETVLPPDASSEFVFWLDKQLSDRNWSDHRLARKAGISHSVISKARKGIPPKWDACAAIAVALDLPPEVVFRHAGLLPPLPPTQGEIEEWRYLLAQLSAKDRYELLQIARLKLRLKRR